MPAICARTAPMALPVRASVAAASRLSASCWASGWASAFSACANSFSRVSMRCVSVGNWSAAMASRVSSQSLRRRTISAAASVVGRRPCCSSRLQGTQFAVEEAQVAVQRLQVGQRQRGQAVALDLGLERARRCASGWRVPSASPAVLSALALRSITSSAKASSSSARCGISAIGNALHFGGLGRGRFGLGRQAGNLRQRGVHEQQQHRQACPSAQTHHRSGFLAGTRRPCATRARPAHRECGRAAGLQYSPRADVQQESGDGQDGGVQASRRAGRVGLPGRAGQRDGRAGRGGDPGMVGPERADQGRGRPLCRRPASWRWCPTCTAARARSRRPRPST